MLANLTWNALGWLPAAAVVFIIAAAATWWLYAREGASRWLMLLRLVALAALALALLQPAVLRAKTNRELGTALFLIDRSASMGFVEQRSPAQWIAIADGLRLLPADVSREVPPITQEDVEQLRDAADRVTRAQSELDYAKLADRGVAAAAARLEEAIARLAAQAQQMLARAKQKANLARFADRLNALATPAVKDRAAWLRELSTKVERVAVIARESETGVAETLYRTSAEARQTSDRLAKLSRLELATLAAHQTAGLMADIPTAQEKFPAAATTQPATPEAGSDLVAAVRSARRRGNLRAIVLLTDGRQVGGSVSADAIAAAGGDVPLYGVRVSRAQAIRDAAIADVRVPERGNVGEVLTVRVDVRSTTLKGETNLTLTDGTATQAAAVTLSDTNITTVEFRWVIDRPGEITLTAKLAPMQWETITDNNIAMRRINAASVNGAATRAYETANEPTLPPEAEMANLSGDDRVLAPLVAAGQGQLLPLEQLAELPAILAADAEARPRLAERRLWDSGGLYVFVVACLGLEWAMRKLAGLS